MSDEAALISAIRKDQRITLSDDELMDLIVEAMEDGVKAPGVFGAIGGWGRRLTFSVPPCS